MSSTKLTPSPSANVENEEAPKTGLRSFSQRKISKEIKIEGETIILYKLSIAAAKRVQKVSNMSDDMSDAEREDRSMDIIKAVISEGIEGGSDMTDSEYQDTPMDILQKIVEEVMIFSGMAPAKNAEGND